jgi:plastocyanin
MPIDHMEGAMKRLFITVLGLGLLLGPAAAQAGALPRSPLVTKNVSVVNFAFMPKTVTITHGTIVRWKNMTTGTTHTTTSNTGLWNKTLAPGATFQRTFNMVGTFKYHCTIHPSMTGSIIVT